MGAPIGISAGMFLGGWLASVMHWRGVFALVGAVGLVLVPFLFFTIKEDRPKAAENARAGGISFTSSLKHIVRRPSFWLMAIGSGFANIPSAGLMFWLPSFFSRSYNLSLHDSSMYCGSIMLVGGLCGAALGGNRD